MIYVRLSDGLGNQMFQYATARRLAHRCNTGVSLDLSAFDKPGSFRKPGLSHLNIKAEIATKAELREKFGLYMKDRPLWEKACSWLKGKKNKIIREKRKFTADERVLKAVGEVYLKGYWQSEQYFSGIRDLLLEEFQISNAPRGRNEQLLKNIRKTNSVALHVRGGDYLSDPKAERIHGLCSRSYYAQALLHIRKRIPDPEFFVFSDDISYAQEILAPLGEFSFLDHNGDGKNFEDLRLMYNCKAHIIANSSFSWWGAWLNTQGSRIVLYPYPWFNIPWDYSALVPTSWIPLPRY